MTTSPFQERVTRLAAWIDAHGGALPKNKPKKKSTEEQKLHEWLNYLSFKFRTGRLEAEKLEQLREVRGLAERLASWEHLLKPPTWEQNLDSLERWARAHEDNLPQSKADNTNEAALGKWVSGLQRKCRAGLLRQDQLEQLRRVPAMAPLLAKWEGVQRSFMCWEERCTQLRDWTHRHANGLPRVVDNDTEQKTLAQWLGQTKTAYMQGELIDEQVTQLIEVPGMLERVATWWEDDPRPTVWDQQMCACGPGSSSSPSAGRCQRRVLVPLKKGSSSSGCARRRVGASAAS